MDVDVLQTTERRVAIGRGQPAFLDKLRQTLLDRAAGSIERRLRDVGEQHRESRLREHLGDPVSHGAGADDCRSD